MTRDITNKEYLRNIIISGLEGKKINQKESEELIKIATNLSPTEWRNFKIVNKEILKEWIDEKIAEGGTIPSNWQNEVKNLGHSLVDLGSAMASQEILQECMRLEKEKVPHEQKMLRLASLYAQQLNKIAAHKKTRKLSASAYHSAEKSLVKKVKELQRMAIATAFRGKRTTAQQMAEAVKKVISLFKNLSADEIYVAKEKAKSLIVEYLNNYAPAEFHQYPELKELSGSVINFMDAFFDEELLAEAVKLMTEVGEIAMENFDWKKLESFDKLPSWEGYKKGYEYGEKVMKETLQQASLKFGLENRVRSLLVNLTKHINRLANEENNNVSTTEAQSIIQKLSAPRQLNGSNNNSAENTGTGLSFISPASVLGSVRGNGNSGGLSADFVLKALNKYTTVESKGKWYQNPWFIGGSIVGALVVGGLAVWILTRRKKEKVVYREDNRW